MNDKEAIERLNRFKTIKVMYGNTFAMHLEQLKQLQQDLETILNILENQKEEIEKKDKIIDELEDIFYNYQLCEYELTDCTYRKCEYIADDEIPPCKECIKQYFKEKVEKEQKNESI